MRRYKTAVSKAVLRNGYGHDVPIGLGRAEIKPGSLTAFGMTPRRRGMQASEKWEWGSVGELTGAGSCRSGAENDRLTGI